MAIKLYYNKNTYQLITIDDGGESIVVGDDGGKEFHFYFGTGTSLGDYVNDVTIPVNYLGRAVIERPDGEVTNELFLTPQVGYFKLIVTDWIAKVEGNLEITARLKVSNGDGGYIIYPFTVATIPVEDGVAPGDDTIEDAQYQAIMDAVDGVIAGTTDIAYDNTDTDIAAVTVQDAITEVNDKANANEQDILNLQNEKEDVANKATVWGTPDDTKYPTTKLVDDRLDPIETFKGSAESRLQIIESDIDNLEDGTTVIPTYELKANKATDFSTVDDNKYPTVEAVKEQLDLKESLANKGQPNGYVGLNGSTLIDSVYLPSYVDDVIEVATYANLPATGETGKLYIVVADETSSNKHSTYRWTGTVYVKIHDEMSASELKVLYESNADTNAFTDLEKAKLAGFQEASRYYDVDYIDALADFNGWQATNLTPTPLTNGQTISTATLNAKDKLTFVCRDTVTGELDSDELVGALVVNGNKLVFFDNDLIFLTIGGTDSTFTSSVANKELIIWGFETSQQEAENIAYDNTDSELVATNVQDAIDELEDEIDAVGTRIDGVDSEIDDLEQKDVLHDSRISTIEEQLRKSFSGEDTATASGTDIISLGGDVANAPINVLVEGGWLDAPQLVTNGDFSDGTTGWTLISIGTPVVTNGIVSFTATATIGRIEKTITNTIGHKYYTVGKVKAGSNLVALKNTTNNDVKYHSGGGNYEVLSIIYTAVYADMYPQVIDYRTSGWTQVDVDYIYAFNISTLIANKQHSPLYNKTFDLMSDAQIKAQMDKWVLDGTLPNDIMAVSMDKRIRSVGKNLFDKGQYATDYAYKIKVKPSTAYVWNVSTAYKTYDINMVEVSSGTATTLTTGSGTYYIAFSGIANVDTFQLELGSTATTYQPYISHDLYLQANRSGYEYQGVRDSIAYRNGKYYFISRVNDTLDGLRTTPIETEILAIGNAQVGPNSSIYIDDIKWATDIYTTNITVTTAIKELVSITKMNTDGSETQLAVSGATVSGDGLSFTHSGLASGDAVRFTYIPRGDYFKGNTDVIYYDSPLIVVDSVTSTVYKLVPTVASGVITWTVEEV